MRSKHFVQRKDAKSFVKIYFLGTFLHFLSVIRQNFEDNLRILANLGNFHVKTQKSTDFAHKFSKTYIFFFFFNIDYTFYTINLFIQPKNCVQILFYNERCKKFCKNQFVSNIFTFLSVIRQNFEDNLRILANYVKFSHKNSKIYGFCPYVLKNYRFFFVFFNKNYTFYTKNLFIWPKN